MPSVVKAMTEERPIEHYARWIRSPGTCMNEMVGQRKWQVFEGHLWAKEDSNRPTGHHLACIGPRSLNKMDTNRIRPIDKD